MSYYFIQVKGEIKTEDDTPQYALGWACGSIGGEVTKPDFSWNNKENVVESDLILNKYTRSVPYAFYYTEKGICGGHITCCVGHGGAYSYFLENISNLKLQLQEINGYSIQPSSYNGLYISTFSALELFLCDTILCYIFSDEKCYQNAVEYYSKQKKSCSDNNDNLLNKTRNYFQHFVYHRFCKVEGMYNEILGKCFPEHSELDYLLHKRNNIVHRFGMDGMSRMLSTDATKEDIEVAINTISSFAASLDEKIVELRK